MCLFSYNYEFQVVSEYAFLMYSTEKLEDDRNYSTILL